MARLIGVNALIVLGANRVVDVPSVNPVRGSSRGDWMEVEASGTWDEEVTGDGFMVENKADQKDTSKEKEGRMFEGFMGKKQISDVWEGVGKSIQVQVPMIEGRLDEEILNRLQGFVSAISWFLNSAFDRQDIGDMPDDLDKVPDIDDGMGSHASEDCSSGAEDFHSAYGESMFGVGSKAYLQGIDSIDSPPDEPIQISRSGKDIPDSHGLSAHPIMPSDSLPNVSAYDEESEPGGIKCFGVSIVVEKGASLTNF